MNLLFTECGIVAGMDILPEMIKRLAPGKTVSDYLKGTRCANKMCQTSLSHERSQLAQGVSGAERQFNCNWCNLFFMNRSVSERILLLDEIANNWIASGIQGRQILENLKRASQESNGGQQSYTPGKHSAENHYEYENLKDNLKDNIAQTDVKRPHLDQTSLATTPERSTRASDSGFAMAIGSGDNSNRDGQATSGTKDDGNNDGDSSLHNGALGISEIDFIELKALFCDKSNHEGEEDSANDSEEVITGTHQAGLKVEMQKLDHPGKLAAWRKWKWSKRRLPSGRKLVNGEGNIDRIFNNLPYALKYCLFIELGLNFAKAQDPLFQDSSSIGSKNCLEFGFITLRRQVGFLVENTRDYRETWIQITDEM
ncbi:hypothetical protein BG005_008135 [Podila minutissima]|nr:hypothetical protein BG005_008135 [Podila minutissima]